MGNYYGLVFRFLLLFPFLGILKREGGGGWEVVDVSIFRGAGRQGAHPTRKRTRRGQ